MNFFQSLEAHVRIEQKVLKYTPVQKLEMFLVGVLAGAKAVSHTDIAVRIDPALVSALGCQAAPNSPPLQTRWMRPPNRMWPTSRWR
jgi:hypothetical protein